MAKMKKISFIHASDLHIDSPFTGIGARSETVAEALRSATFDAFDALVQFCIDKEVQFLLVSGDIYDGADRSLRAQLKFLDGMKRLADHNISSFIAHGNHDSIDGWSSTIKWPDKVHIFKADPIETKPIETKPGETDPIETKTIKINGEPVAAISGISYGSRNERRNLAKKFKAADPDLFQIGVLHCNCGGNTNHENYAPCRLEDLTKTGFDYWALGHVHEKKILNKNPYVVYSGNTQGLNIRETGERGCYHVVVDENRHVDIEFCPLDAVRWFTARIDITDIDSIDGLDIKIVKSIDRLREQGKGRPVICRIFLTGRGLLYKDLRQKSAVPDLLERIRETGLTEDPFVWVQNFEVNCWPETDLEKRRDLNDLLGQVLRISKNIGDAGNDSQALKDALMPALCGLYENHRIAKFLDPPSGDDLKKILQDAELLCVDLLETDL